MRVRQGIPWFWLVVLLAAGALALVTVWVLDGGVNRGEALKTGGLAAGSVVALYALWLNDRRRRVEERRVEHDEERVADERFARAVELLGHEADQVRVGALHALAGLARSRERYTQVVLDVLCAYLRRPFGLPPDGDQAVREQQVRMTAQRLIADLLPRVSDEDPPVYNLDLHGATLDHFDISHRVVGELRARQTSLHGWTSLRESEIRGPAWFTGAHCPGELDARGMVFQDRSVFTGFEAKGSIDFTGARFRSHTKFDNAIVEGRVSFGDAEFDSSHDLFDMKVALNGLHQLPAGYSVDGGSDRKFGLVRADAPGT